MEEIIWLMRQRSRELQDFRYEIRSSWEDEAAKELNTRYLNPHEDDNQEMLRSLNLQNQGLENAKLQLTYAQENALEADKLSKDVYNLLEQQKHDVNIAYQYSENCFEACKQTQTEIDLVKQFIRKADNSCGGVDTSKRFRDN